MNQSGAVSLEELVRRNQFSFELLAKEREKDVLNDSKKFVYITIQLLLPIFLPSFLSCDFPLRRISSRSTLYGDLPS